MCRRHRLKSRYVVVSLCHIAWTFPGEIAVFAAVQCEACFGLPAVWKLLNSSPYSELSTDHLRDMPKSTFGKCCLRLVGV